jgi:predicted Zn-dependent protease
MALESRTKSRRRRRVVVAVILGAGVLGASSWRPITLAWTIHRGEKLLAIGEPQQALAEFLEAERRDPRHGRNQFLLARTYRRLGDSAAVQKHLQLAHRRGVDPRILEREWILAQAQAGLMAQAEPHFKGLFTNPGDDGPEICAAFASGYVLNYQFEPAQRVLDAWQGDYPNDPEPHLMLGKIQHRWQNLPRAEAEIRTALRLRPDDRAARAFLARILVEQQKYEDAMPLIEGLLQETPRDGDLRMIWADCLIPLGRHAEALAVFAEIVEREPDNCHALLGLGQIELWRDDSQAALKHLDRAVKQCPDRLDVRFARAQALGIRGERDASRKEFEYVDRARTALARAYELAGKLVREPGNTENRIEIGKALIEFGDRVEGAAWLKTVLEYEPANLRVHRLLADYYTKLGEPKQAARHVEALARGAGS